MRTFKLSVKLEHVAVVDIVVVVVANVVAVLELVVDEGAAALIEAVDAVQLELIVEDDGNDDNKGDVVRGGRINEQEAEG